ncbi:unnamed protein product [Acanthoscelides obtectus]|uniref:Uncharacterized protein n=1 Tax=Acanthoscelides obtectus TaxID=200917 RepID=A0A9P0PA63_ACAOB|nr:unnamed protein product [Acanthoscelides obtectus]CAK1661628.1 hypothetical protein AOBTE_LOCUS22726 [Acanthoscelides obtectus]
MIVLIVRLYSGGRENSKRAISLWRTRRGKNGRERQ